MVSDNRVLQGRDDLWDDYPRVFLLPGVIAGKAECAASRVVVLSRFAHRPHFPTGAYDLVDARAELSWTASSDPELASYELRSTPGPDYPAEDESTVASIPPGGPLAYTSSAGFGQPGNAVS